MSTPEYIMPEVPSWVLCDYRVTFANYMKVLNTFQARTGTCSAKIDVWKHPSDFVSEANPPRPSLVVRTITADTVVLRNHFRPSQRHTEPYTWDFILYDYDEEEGEPLFAEVGPQDKILPFALEVIAGGFHNSLQAQVSAAKYDIRINVLKEEVVALLSGYNFIPVPRKPKDRALRMVGKNGADISVRRDGVKWAYTVNGGETRTDKIDVMLPELTAALSSGNTDADTTDEENISL